MAIHLEPPLPTASSGLPGGCSSRERAGHPYLLLDLAPDGVCPAAPVARHAGELLPHPFTLTGRAPPREKKLRLRRSALCCTCRGSPRLGLSPASCPVEPGLSSTRASPLREHGAAATRPAPYYVNDYEPGWIPAPAAGLSPFPSTGSDPRDQFPLPGDHCGGHEQDRDLDDLLHRAEHVAADPPELAPCEGHHEHDDGQRERERHERP